MVLARDNLGFRVQGPSAVSRQPSAVSRQPSAVSRESIPRSARRVKYLWFLHLARQTAAANVTPLTALRHPPYRPARGLPCTAPRKGTSGASYCRHIARETGGWLAPGAPCAALRSPATHCPPPAASSRARSVGGAARNGYAPQRFGNSPRPDRATLATCRVATPPPRSASHGLGRRALPPLS